MFKNEGAKTMNILVSFVLILLGVIVSALFFFHYGKLVAYREMLKRVKELGKEDQELPLDILKGVAFVRKVIKEGEE